jgi:hypothetical protein
MKQTLFNQPKFRAIAWTGGCRPAKPSAIGSKQAGVQKALFGEQVMDFLTYWGDSPNWDTLRIFFRRARYDAHATCRK